MKSIALVGAVLSLAAGTMLPAVGCAVNTTPNTEPEAHLAAQSPQSANTVKVDLTPVKTEYGTIVAQVTTADGHNFVFGVAALSGGMVVQESGKVGESPKLPGLINSGTGVAEIFNAVAGGASVPTALLTHNQVQRDVMLAERPFPGASYVPPLPAQAPGKVHPMTWTTEQTWFDNNVCPGNNPSGHNISVYVCLIGNTDINPTNFFYITDSTGYYNAALMDSSAVEGGNMLEYLWNGSAWNLDWTSGYIGLGDWMFGYWGDSGTHYRSTVLLEQGGFSGDPGGLAMGTCCN